MRVMRVQLELGGATTTAAGLTQLVDRLEKVGTAARTARAALRTTRAQSINQAVTRTSTAGPETEQAASVPKQAALRIPAGPFQRLAQAQANLKAALERGTTTQVQDARQALEGAQRVADRLTAAKPPSATRTLVLKPLNVSGPFQRLARAQETLREALLRGTTAQVKDAQTAVDQAQRAASRLSAPKSFTVPQGPFQRLAQAQANLREALQQGTVAQIADARNAVDQAQKRADALYQSSLGKTLKLPAPPKAFSLAGPNARLTRAQDDLQKAIQGGVASQISDAEIAVRKAQERLTRAQRPAPRSTLGGRLAELILSTRVNIPGLGGFGASPLVGRLLTAIGATGKEALLLGGLGAAATVAAFALKAFAETVKQGAESLAATAAARSISGGTPGQIASLQAFGLSPESIAGLAAAVRGARSSNPFAMAQFGFQLPRPFGNVNEAEGLEQVIHKLAGVDAQGKRLAATLDTLNTAEKRLRAARLAEVDSLIPLIEAIRRSPELYAADEAARKRIVSPQALKSAQDLAYATSRMKSNWDLLGQALAKPFLKDLTTAANNLASAARTTATVSDHFAQTHPRIVAAAQKTFIQNLLDAILPGLGGLYGFASLPYGKSGSSASNPQVSATKANTAAIIDLSKLIKGGTYGGGERARGAFPKYLVPAAASSNMDWDSVRNGFWKL